MKDLEAALRITEKDSVPRLPSLFLNRQQKSLKEARKKFQLLLKRHEERCKALYYGLGVVQEGDTWRAPAEELGAKEKKRLSRESNGSQVEDPVVMAREAAGEVVVRGEQPVVEAEGDIPDREIIQEVKDQIVSKA